MPPPRPALPKPDPPPNPVPLAPVPVPVVAAAVPSEIVSPARSPDPLTCVPVVPTTPVVTGTRFVVPAVTTSTYDPLPDVWIAAAGTDSALAGDDCVVTVTSAVSPYRTPDGRAASVTVTGKTTTPADEVPTGAIAVTVAVLVTPLAAGYVTDAVCPVFSAPTSDSGTSVVTTSCDVSAIVTTPPEPVDDAVPDEPFVPPEPDPPDPEPPDPDPPLVDVEPVALGDTVCEPVPDTVCPTAPETATTSPETGAVRVASPTAVWASVTAVWSEVTFAWSARTCVCAWSTPDADEALDADAAPDPDAAPEVPLLVVTDSAVVLGVDSAAVSAVCASDRAVSSLDSAACASVNCPDRAAVPMVAIVCPAWTVCPSCTSSVAIVPPTANPTAVSDTGATLPVVLTPADTDPCRTVPVRRAPACADAGGAVRTTTAAPPPRTSAAPSPIATHSCCFDSMPRASTRSFAAGSGEPVVPPTVAPAS